MKFQAVFLSSQSCHAFFHSVGCHMLVLSLDLISTKFLTLLEVSHVTFPNQVCLFLFIHLSFLVHFLYLEDEDDYTACFSYIKHGACLSGLCSLISKSLHA